MNTSAENSRRTMIRFTEFINTVSEQLAAKLISPNAIFHVPGRAKPMRGPAGYLAIIGMMRGGFPDIHATQPTTITRTLSSAPSAPSTLPR